MPRRIDFKWRYQTNSSTPEGMIIDFIRSQKYKTLSEMIIPALKGFWLAEAVAKSGDCSQAEIHQAREEAAWYLEKQAEYIRSFGLGDQGEGFSPPLQPKVDGMEGVSEEEEKKETLAFDMSGF